jgi:hypothetical protein
MRVQPERTRVPPVNTTATTSVSMGRGTSIRALRAGLSTSTYVSCERPRANTDNATATGQLSLPMNTAANTSTGQCQRYQLYDRRPSACIGAEHRPRESSDDVPCAPAISIAQVPRTGTSAYAPGKGVAESNSNAAAMTVANPPQSRGVSAFRPHATGSRHASAPRANSQARVGDEKNAHGCATRVSHTDEARETSVSAPMTQSNRLRFPPRNAKNTSRGQTK